MREFFLPTLADYRRPVVELYGLQALIDTGAVIPMFSLPLISMTEKLFPGEKIRDNVPISGISGIAMGCVYSINEFRVGEMCFSPFEVFVPHEMRIKYPLLLSATLFYGTDYGFDTNNNIFHITVSDDARLNKEFRLKFLAGTLYPQIDGVLLQDSDVALIDPPIGIF